MEVCHLRGNYSANWLHTGVVRPSRRSCRYTRDYPIRWVSELMLSVKCIDTVFVSYFTIVQLKSFVKDS